MKNLNKTQKILGSILVIFAAVMTLLAIIFGINWKNQKDANKNNAKTDVMALEFDTNGDLIPDLFYNFSGNFKGKTLGDIVSNDMPKESPYKFDISKGWLNGINKADGSSLIDIKEKHYWAIYSPTSNDTGQDFNGNDGYAMKGISDLYLAKANLYIFSYQGY